jgi:soluble lytic murein transglycosylase-like protein
MHEDTVVILQGGGGAIEVPRQAVVRVEQRPDPPVPVREAIPTALAMSRVESPKKTPTELVHEAAERYGLPPAFVHHVAKAESALKQEAVSPKGAIGVMQLMPGTAASLGADPYDAEENVDAGARHLRDLLVRYQGSAHKALAAYNAGEGAVERYKGVPPYAETQNYINRILGGYLRETKAEAK